jgi:hypothetical protein
VNDNNTQALFVFTFPVVLSIGIVLIPVVSDYADHTIATDAVNMTGRWFVGHILSAVAFGLGIQSVYAIKDYLKDRGYELPQFMLPIMAIGAGLYAAGLGADGIGPIAVKNSGSSPALFFDGSGWFVTGTFIAATLFFGVGLISLVGHVNQSGIVKGIWKYVIIISALVFVAVPAIPSGWGLYGEAVAACGVFVPMGLAILRSEVRSRRSED